MATLYVGNLAWEIKDEELMGIFVENGVTPISAEVVMSRGGRSQGYGLVALHSAEDAASATQLLNEQEYWGRRIVVREDRGGSTSRSAPAAGQQQQQVAAAVNELALYVGNLSWETTEEAVAEVFGSFNPSDVSLKMGRNGRSRGWAIVAFQTADAAQSALDAMHGFEVDGRELQCRFDEGTGLKTRATRSTRTPRQEFSPPSTNSLYIGNLANATSSDDLFNWFVENNLNVVSADVVQSRGGRSQGYAIAVFQDTEDATNAINLLNGQEFMDRVVVLREDRGSSRPAAAQNAAPSEFALFVGNLSWNTTEEEVVEAFGQFNPTEVSLKIGRNGRSRGFAIATFQSTEEAQTALDSMDGYAMDGREIRLKFDRA